MIDLLPYAVKLKIYLHNLNIECLSILNQKVDSDITNAEHKRLTDKYSELNKRREWVYLELHELRRKQND
ncbi:hypothetical protein FKHLMAOI_00006 [Enterococcus phage KEF1]